MLTALLIIDVQEGLFQPSPRPAAADDVIDRINALSRRAREDGQLVVFIQHTSPGSLASGSPGWQLAGGLQVDGTDARIEKTSPDSFYRTGLQDLLTRHRVTEVVVCGYATEFCVDTTVRRAATLGFPVTLVADAHTTHDKPHAAADVIRRHHTCTLPSMSSFPCRITAVDASDIVFRCKPATI